MQGLRFEPRTPLNRKDERMKRGKYKIIAEVKYDINVIIFD